MASGYFEQRERALLGARYDQLYNGSQQVQKGITLNRLRVQESDALHLLEQAGIEAEPSPFCSDAFVLKDADAKPGRHPYHHAGVYYVQEPSASAPAQLLGVRAGQKVLDLCAAPGGKSSQLASALGGTGVLVCNEYNAARARVLKNNLERMGAANTLVFNEDAAHIARAFPGWFDRVLVDAPCSGEGMFRKEPQAVAQHGPGLVRQCAALGREILEAAAACLAPGGLLCFSTCTFAPQEDEGQVGAFLARHPEFSLEDLRGLPFGSEGEPARSMEYPFEAVQTRRIYPCHGGEGHFMALLKKTTGDMGRVKQAQGAPLPAPCSAFLRRYFPALADGPAVVAGESVYLLPPGIPAWGSLRLVRAGVEAGRCVKGRFEPAHGLFMAFGAACENAERLDLNDSRTAAWLRGEEIAAVTAQEGFCAVLVDGFPLGGGKVSGGRVKNRYPKGLRNV